MSAVIFDLVPLFFGKVHTLLIHNDVKVATDRCSTGHATLVSQILALQTSDLTGFLLKVKLIN